MEDLIIDTTKGKYKVLDKQLFFAFISKQIITPEVIWDLTIKNIIVWIN